MALPILLNDKYKLESLQEDGSRTRQEIPQTAGCKARARNCCFRLEEANPSHWCFPLKWTSIKKLWGTRNDYELLLEIFSMEKLNSLLYRNCSVNFFTVPPELTRVGMLDFFRCTLQSVANHVIVRDRNHAKRGEYVLSIRMAEWPLRSVFVEQCCSGV